MLSRWLFAGFVAASLAAASLSAADVAAQAAKAAPKSKKPTKAPKLDLSQMTLLRKGAGQDQPEAAKFGPGKALDATPSPDLVNVRPELVEAERTVLREQISKLLAVEAAALPTFKTVSHINNPGDTVVLALNSPPGNPAYITISDAQRTYRTNNGPGFVRLAGDDAAAGRSPFVAFHADAGGERVYLYTCFIDTRLPSIAVSVIEHGTSLDSGHFRLPIQEGKLFVPYETAKGTSSMTLYLSLDASAAGGYAVITHCELTLVR